jgi:hypothetical protein
MSVDVSATPVPHHRPWCGGPIRLLYAGFDGLDVAFQGRLSDPVLEVLTDARAEAEAILGPVIRETNGLRFTVAPSGARNGFRYRLDTGDDGEVWLIKHSPDPRQWNLFVSVRAFALLAHGYGGVRRRLSERLAAFEADIAAVSVHRVDLACDFAAPAFEPDPDGFVAPARTQARSYHPGDDARAAETTVHRLARRVNGVTVGRMPRGQLCLYDKRADSLSKRKLFWGQVWGIDLKERREPVWRIEPRAGRDELARHLPRRSFAAVEGALPEVVASMFAKVRYVVPSPTDMNPARWPNHPIWDAAGNHLLATIQAHSFVPTPARPGLTTPRDAKRAILGRQLIGLAHSYAALAGFTAEQAEEIPDLVAALLRDDWRLRPQEVEQGLERARARHGVLE